LFLPPGRIAHWLFTLALAAPAFAQEHHWDYGKEHGPLHWGEEFKTCGVGHRQSPIDIVNAEKADLPPLGFDYKPSRLAIVDNGHTILVNYAAGSSLRVGGSSYMLTQFHFHLPSEERIQGRSFDMVAHLVHTGANGQLAVVAVLLEKGKENGLVKRLWDSVPKESGKEAVVEAAQVNAAELLPADRGYYTYPGSLTTPPCSEAVTWFVLKQPVQVSADEVAGFAKWYSNNARPPQPLFDRVVKESH
jgi:carbonic anhydrase